MRKRVHLRGRDLSDDVIVSFTFQQAFDYFYSAKKLEDMRKTTLITYKEHFNFFMNWVRNTNKDIGLVKTKPLVYQLSRTYKF